MINVDDIVETSNHYRIIDSVIDNAEKALTENYIKELHFLLKPGTSDSRRDWFRVGEYKYPISFCRIIHHHVSNNAHELAVLNNG